MPYLRNSILATLIYYDIFDYPLTLSEIHKYLINPARIYKIAGGLGGIRVSDIAGELNQLVGSKIIGTKDGFYFLGGRDGTCSERIEKNKIADRKWRKALRQIRYLALAPYLRGVFVSGSMAMNNTTEDSDFDVLIISKPGRLYTCRLFLWLISSVLGVRRKRFEKKAPDKLCFNHYLTGNKLRLTHQSIFNAQTYINLKPAMMGREMINSFFASNLWLNDYAYNFKIQNNSAGRSVKPPAIFSSIASSVEFILNSAFGNYVENFLKNFQQNRIKANPATYESGGRVVFTDNELEFHPRSFEKVVIERYNSGLEKFGISPYVKETDSGLLQ